MDWLEFWFCVPELEGYQRTVAEMIYLMSFDLIYDTSRWGHGVYTEGVDYQTLRFDPTYFIMAIFENLLCNNLTFKSQKQF
jgi:hypothetical protein